MTFEIPKLHRDFNSNFNFLTFEETSARWDVEIDKRENIFFELST